MTNQGIGVNPPSRKRAEADDPTSVKFSQQSESDKVQFNKRITRATADGYDILAIRARKKVPELLAEGLELLEEKYGKI